MKLKHYLRGLGMGIIAATIVLAISFGAKSKEITDEEIIAKAKELGMEMKEESVLTKDEGNKEKQPNTEADGSKTDNQKPQNQEGTPPVGNDVQNNENIPKQNDQNAQPKVLKITAGMGSEKVSKALSDLGLVEYTEFNRFLIQNGYDSKIRIGEYSITPGTEYKDIAVMITSKK